MRLFGLAVILTAFAARLSLRASRPLRHVSANRRRAMIIKVVPLAYARAGEVAFTLSLVAQPPLRIVPYYPTNSLVISGPPAAVKQLIEKGAHR